MSVDQFTDTGVKSAMFRCIIGPNLIKADTTKVAGECT